MTTKEKNNYIKQFREYRIEITSTKAKAEKFMKDAGIHDKNGKLKRQYK